MRKPGLIRAGLVWCLVLTLGLGLVPIVPAAPAGPAAGQPASADSLLFIENVGQFPAAVRYQTWGGPTQLWLTNESLWLRLTQPPNGHNAQPVDLRLSFVAANPRPTIEPLAPLPTQVSYFIGNDPSAWRAAVPVWSGVRYRDLYPGLDLVVSSAAGHWHWRWEVTGTEGLTALASARLRVEGAATMQLASGELLLSTAIGPHPLALPALDAAAPVTPLLEGGAVVAPVGTGGPAERPLAATALGDLVYSTFLGGSSDDFGTAVAVDSAGHAYVTGYTDITAESAFPTTPGTIDQSHNGSRDIFVAKLNPAGSGLVYATFLGGSGTDAAQAVAVDGSGAVYLVGSTDSANFPTTAGAFDTSPNGSTDAFVAKLNPAGSGLVYASFLGGSGSDAAFTAAIDSSGALYLAGRTDSANFPTTPGANDTSYGGNVDAFAVKLNPAGAALVYATYLGGSNLDVVAAVAVDSTGAVILAGSTGSADFPVTTGAFDQTYNGSFDAFVARLNPAGSSLINSTFLGGTSGDGAAGVALDAAGAVYVVGNTGSGDFPTTPGAYDTSFNSPSRDDIFAIKLDASLNAPLYSTFLGGGDNDRAKALAIDSTGAVYLAGSSASSDFPTASAYDNTFNGSTDAIVAKLDPAGSTLLFSTFLGGDPVEEAHGLAVDGRYAYVVGHTRSTSFPSTGGAFDQSNNGRWDAFALKLEVTPPPPTPTPTQTPTPRPGSPTATPTATPTSAPPPPPLPNDRPFAHPAFRQRWAASDEGAAGRTYVYGPAPFTDGRSEPYVEAPGGQRLVQYFDKARMELTDPASGLVTAGLLATELITGNQQNGDATFQARGAARVPVAGDPSNPFPYYADLAPLRERASDQRGQVANRRLQPGGAFTLDPGAGSDPQAVLTGYDPETGHNIPRAFAEFRDSPAFGGILTIGLAITEPVWAEVQVGGVPRRVLIQAFERRVLTYTPDNPDGFRVEYGNIGRHYYLWRYHS